MPKINPNTSIPIPANQTEERKPISKEKIDDIRKDIQSAIDILADIKALDEELERLKESERLRKG